MFVKRSSDTSSDAASSQVDAQVAKAISYVAQYMGDSDDWVDIKIEIMNNLRPEMRRLFSRRDQQTREQVPSEFDRAVMREYERVSGIALVVRTLAERRALRSGVSDE